MGGDMMTALGRAVAEGHTLFGHNAAGCPQTPLRLERTPGGSHAPDERLRATLVELPQARQTCAVLGARPPASWGYCHGINLHGVAAGCTRLRTRLRLDAPGLTGPDLVRLALERGPTARQALEAVTALVARHGQGAYPGCDDEHGEDAAVLIADGHEAFLVEASGTAWVYQEVGAVRAASDVCTVRQDWDAIAPGLAGRVIERGWWPEDGSKLDFAGTLGAGADTDSALRRWAQATLLLEEQSGHIDIAFLRRVLADHYDGAEDEVDPHEPGAGPRPLCCHATASRPKATVGSLIAVLGAAVPLSWCAFGTPCESVYLPLLPAGELPPALAGDGDLDLRFTRLAAAARDPARRGRLRAALDGLQALFDAEAAEFLAEVPALQAHGDADELRRQAMLFMLRAWEEYAEVTDGFIAPMPAHADVAVGS
jgi:secernin